MATITATCITQRLRANSSTDDRPSGIDKAAVDVVTVTPRGVDGDEVRDTEHHGGRDKAVYAYSDEDAAWWAGELGIDLPAGRFGENLRIAGLDIGALVLGTRLRVGHEVELEVSEPRVPCGTFKHHMDDRPGWVKRFTTENRTGTYLRVHQGGTVQAGDVVTVASVPAHGVTVAGWFGANDRGDAQRLLDAAADGWDIPAALRSAAEHALSADG